MNHLAWACGVWLAAIGSASAENWPQFRGPAGQGISSEKSLPLNWSTNSNVAWKTPIPGEGWSSPVVFGERVFVTTATDNGTTLRVVGLDRKSGAILWNRPALEQVPRRKEGKNSFASPTPVTDGKRVYAVFGDGSVVALAAKDGAVIWTNREVKFYSRHGLGASPRLHRDLLIMPFDGSNPVGAAGNWPAVSDDERLGWQIPWDKSFINAYDVRNGTIRWTAKRGMSRIAHVTPVVAKFNGTEQLVSGAGDVVQGFDLQKGERLWSVRSQGEGVVPSIVVGDGLVYSASGFEKSTIRAVRPASKGRDAEIVWEQTKGVPNLPSLLYVKPHLYSITDGGVALCLNGATGDIVWQERIGGNHSASPVFADGRIYFLSEQGETAVIEAGPVFKEVARNSIGEKCQASMAISQGNIFIRSANHLWCIGKSR